MLTLFAGCEGSNGSDTQSKTTATEEIQSEGLSVEKTEPEESESEEVSADKVPSDREILVSKWAEDFQDPNGKTSFRAIPFICADVRKNAIHVASVEVIEGHVYINGVLYNRISLAENLGAESYEYLADEAERSPEKLGIFEKIKTFSSYYVLEPAKSSGVNDKWIFCDIERIYFFLYISHSSDSIISINTVNYESGIEGTEKESDLKLIEFDKLVEDISSALGENGKIKLSPSLKYEHDSFKDTGLYRYLPWDDPEFSIIITWDDQCAIDEAWYDSDCQYDMKGLNELFYSHYLSGYTEPDISKYFSDGSPTMQLYYSTDAFKDAYSAFINMSESECVVEIVIFYIYPIPVGGRAE